MLFFISISYILLVKNMLDILKSYFKKEKFYIIITNNSLYIKNYKRLINIDENEVLVELMSNIMKVNGNNLILKRTVGKDLVINGNIESVKYI